MRVEINVIKLYIFNLKFSCGHCLRIRYVTSINIYIMKIVVLCNPCAYRSWVQFNYILPVENPTLLPYNCAKIYTPVNPFSTSPQSFHKTTLALIFEHVLFPYCQCLNFFLSFVYKKMFTVKCTLFIYSFVN